MKPRLSILDPAFKYTNSLNTDIRVTFRRIRLENEQRELQADIEVKQPTNVAPIAKKARKP